MELTIKEIISFLENLAPLNYQESYDNAGLIVGNPANSCTRVLLCLDATEAIIDEAVEKQCEMVIAHHPIVFGGLKKLNGKNYVERAVIKAIKNDIALYAIHTNLDNVATGVNKRICDELGIHNYKILAPKRRILKKMSLIAPLTIADQARKILIDLGAGNIAGFAPFSFDVLGVSNYAGLPQQPEFRLETVFPEHLEKNIVAALHELYSPQKPTYEIFTLDNAFDDIGSGMIGDLLTPIPTADFLQAVKTIMKTECMRHTRLVKPTVQRVAVCGGAGVFLLPDALRAGADVFITADVKYHQFFDADNRIILADIGHYESEQFTIELLGEQLSKKFPTFAVLLTEANTNPIQYL